MYAWHCTGAWAVASEQRAHLLTYIQNCSGVGTLLDYRRVRDYDADDSVSRYLNQGPVKVRAQPACSSSRAPQLSVSCMHAGRPWGCKGHQV